MTSILLDVRLAVRNLLRHRGFTFVLLFTMGLGIGADTTIFSVVNGVLWKPLPYRDPDRLVLLSETSQQAQVSLSYPDYRDWREQNTVFSSIAAFQSANFNLVVQGEVPERAQGYRASASLFPTLGVKAVLGRVFDAAEDRPGAQVAVLGYSLWQRLFGGQPGVLGKPVGIGDRTFTVIGVMPPGFNFYQGAEIWVPLGLYADDKDMSNRVAHAGIYGVARLRPGVMTERAQRDLDAIAARVARENAGTNSAVGALVTPILEDAVGDVRRSLLVLFTAVGFVLLIACANAANLLAVRASMRTREVAVRMAVGADRGRLARHYLTESLTMTVLAGFVGLLVAAVCLKLLVVYNPGNIPRLEEIAINGPVLAFTFGVSLVTGLLFGLVPIIQSWSPDLQEHLKGGVARGASGVASWRRLREGLVAVEIALSLILLVGAGLMIQSFAHLMRVDPGYDVNNVLTMQMSLPTTKYPQRYDVGNFYRRLLDRVAALPGVKAAGIVNPLPLSGNDRTTDVEIEGIPLAHPSQGIRVDWAPISPGYLQAMGIPLLQGRGFLQHEQPGPPITVAIVDRTMAERFWAGTSPIGKRFRQLSGPTPGTQPWITIVGVVARVKNSGVQSTGNIQMYAPFDQIPLWGSTLVVRSDSDPAQLTTTVRRVVLTLDPELPVFNIRTMKDLFSKSVAQPRFSTLLLIALALVALVLALIGLYGVVSYSVTQRTREVGLRMAIGADRKSIWRLVVGWAVVPILSGIGIGLAGAYALARTIRSLLFAVSATDLGTFAAIAALLAFTGFLGTCVPAFRAATMNPSEVIRQE